MRRSRTWRHEQKIPGKVRGKYPRCPSPRDPRLCCAPSCTREEQICSGPSPAPQQLPAGHEGRMWGVILAGCLLLDVTAADLLYRSGRRTCSSGGRSGLVPVTQSYVQPVHKPVMAVCEGHRVCSTYRTTYRISYRQVPKNQVVPLFSCCPGWRRMTGHGCHDVSCRLPCQNGGTCVSYNRCQCAEGWSGNHCQTDVDECESGARRCSQSCTNTYGSFRCGCRQGFSLSSDGRSCHTGERATTDPPQSSAHVETETMRKEMQELRGKMEALEQKLQMALAPFLSLLPVAPEDGPGPATFLTRSFQQLDRIESLSEQISFLEERLETCSCKNEL